MIKDVINDILKDMYIFKDRGFKNRSALALFLKVNFKKSLSYLDDGSLMEFLEKDINEIYSKVIELTKNYEKKENILTLIIYLIDNTAGINTLNYHFKSNYDIANAMRKSYPSVDSDVQTLFTDEVLAHIFWNEYMKTGDARYKRNYTFMLHVYENRMYNFTYYYYLYLHLEKNETIRFTLDGLKMKTLAEVSQHLVENIDRAGLIIDEILANQYILALMSVSSGVDKVVALLNSKKKFEILKLLSTYSDVDLSLVVSRRMSFWLLENYKNYNYETAEAKELFIQYGKINRDFKFNSINDYIEIYDKLERLYKKFVQLFNHNRVVDFKKGITSEEDYYLSYCYNSEYVCRKFLEEYNLYNPQVHTEIYQDTVERDVLVETLNVEKQAVVDFKNDVMLLTAPLNFDSKNLSGRLFISSMYLILVIVSLVGGLLMGLKADTDINTYIRYGMFGSSSISIVLLLVSLVKYNRKVKASELISDVNAACGLSLEKIDKEIEAIHNPSSSSKHTVLLNLGEYEKNRKKAMAKVRKISKQKTTVCNGLLITATSLAILPILELGLPALLYAFKIDLFAVYLNDYAISLISLGVLVIHLVLSIIFRKKRFPFYLIYLYAAIMTVVSILLR